MEKIKRGESVEIAREFLNGLKRAIGQHDREINEGKSDFNLIGALGLNRREVYHSKLLAYFLDGVNNNHYQKIFLEKFLEKLQKEKSIPSKIFKRLTPQDIQSIEIEAPTKKNRRIDILITCTDKTYIVIENKIDACDQVSQIKDYVLDTHRRMGRKMSENEKANRILVIYLTPYEDNPSEMSFGKTSSRKKNYWYLWEDKEGTNRIYDENDTRMAYYYKMDYRWIDEWLNECRSWLEEESKKTINGISKGEQGLNKVIFGIDQYIEILEEINNKRIEKNSVIDFILSEEKYKKMALAILQDQTHEYHEFREKINNIWSELSKEVLHDFYNRLIEYFEDRDIKLGKQSHIWKAFAYDNQCTDTLCYYQIGFYPKEYSENNIWIGVNLSFHAHNFQNPTLDIDLVWNEGSEQECEELQEKVRDILKNRDSEKCKDIFRIKGSYNLSLMDKSLVSWIIEQGSDDIENFQKEIENFLNRECVDNAFCIMEGVLKK